MGIENSGDTDFESFANSGSVEGSFDGGANADKTAEGGDDDGKDEKKPVARRGPPKPAVEVTRGGVSDDDGDDDGDNDDGEEGEKKRPSAAEQQINRLKREKADLNRRLRALEGGAGSAALQQRIDALEARLTGGKTGDSSSSGTKAPDPTDTDKYPLGHLDDRYIEDKLEWLADQKVARQAEKTDLQRQQEERNNAVRQAQMAVLEKVDTLATKGSEQFDDFQESVVEAGMRGDWKLTQTTFEAAHDAENGAQILYELSQDHKEAARVASLSPIQQLKFVLDRDAAISGDKKPRTKPKAGEPPLHGARGANSKTSISPATDNLDDFEKAWKRDEKASR